MATEFANNLARSLCELPLLDAPQQKELTETLQKQFPEQVALAKELIRRGWLTLWQARLLLQGRAAGLVLGEYVLLDLLGEGGNGQVFKARQQRLKRIVALKVIRPELMADQDIVKRFYREIEVASHLSDPHIVHAFDAGMIGSTLVMAMEFVDGVDLQRMVKEKGPLPPAVACEYIRQAALGLQHAHEKGLVHRDIKPANLLVTRTGPQRSAPMVKILDLGLARLHQPPPGSKTQNLTVLAGNQTVMGTPDYQAPEQAIDFHMADVRSDLYSLGCTLYYLLTGRPPFEGSLAEKLIKHQQAKPKPIEEIRTDLPVDLPIILDKLMAKQPRERFQTPAELAQALRGLLLALPASTPLETPPTPMPAPRDPGPGSSTTKMRMDTSTTSELMLDQPLPAWALRKAQEPPPPKGVLAHVKLIPWPMLALLAGMVLVICGGLALIVSQALFGGGKPVAVTEPIRPTEPVRPTAVEPPKPVFLSDLPELDAKVGHGKFAKKGELGYDNRRIVVKGLPSENGLSMHPPANGFSTVSYPLSKKFQTFKATAAINDSVANSETALTFQVLGDGKLLWKSRPLKNKGDTQECPVSVASIDKLSREVRCPGGSGRAHAVWVDPQLLP
ncbi:MAG: protein kinase [Planctomycetia bacterium]|nr:protein kinase [Planctomycetia bacterium]